MLNAIQEKQAQGGISRKIHMGAVSRSGLEALKRTRSGRVDGVKLGGN